VRVGLLSTANINRKVIAAGVDVVAVASRDEARARAFADEHGIARAHGSYEALLADDDVEAVYVSLPNSMHVDWSIRALEAGKHVLCEKPLSRDPAEAERAFDAAERAGRNLMEGFMWRHTPQARKLLELLPDPIRLVRAHFSFSAREEGDIRLNPALQGGALMDVGCYCVSAARFVCGAEPESVTAQAVGDGVDVAFTGTLRFPGDTLAHFDCAMTAANRSELEIVGDETSVLVRDPFHSRDVGIEVDGEHVDVEFRDPYLCEFEALAGGGWANARADAVGQARALQLLHQSAKGN
jgi:D-xylose 1-dehydrogenase (NADP+, D-xylono-1,5-lactone-forming)